MYTHPEKFETSRNKMADNYIRELKRLQKEKDFQEKRKQISDITNFQRIKKKHKIEKTELELLNQIPGVQKKNRSCLKVYAVVFCCSKTMLCCS